MKCENVKWKMWWYEEDFECIMKLTRIQWIYVSYSDTLWKTSNHNELSRWMGLRMKDTKWIMNDINRPDQSFKGSLGSVQWRYRPRRIGIQSCSCKRVKAACNLEICYMFRKKLRKGRVFSCLWIEKKIVREENGFEKMTSENESKDGVVKHFKEQKLESRKICQKFLS